MKKKEVSIYIYVWCIATYKRINIYFQLSFIYNGPQYIMLT